MRFTIPLAVLALAAFQASPAFAQTPSTAPTAPAPAASQPSAVAPAMPAPATSAPAMSAPSSGVATHRAHSRVSLQQRFDAANTTHDGHLTLGQAKAGLPSVARHFNAVDKDKKGYVTLEEIHAYNTQHRAHHTAAHRPATPS